METRHQNFMNSEDQLKYEGGGDETGVTLLDSWFEISCSSKITHLARPMGVISFNNKGLHNNHNNQSVDWTSFFIHGLSNCPQKWALKTAQPVDNCGPGVQNDWQFHYNSSHSSFCNPYMVRRYDSPCHLHRKSLLSCVIFYGCIYWSSEHSFR